jgi:diacylglycerol kinase family enzyme
MALVLLNPHAQGGRAARQAPALAAWLSAHAPGVTLAAPDSLADSLALLRSLPTGSRVVAVGGDGTLNRWLPAVLDQQLQLGLVPMGSGNDSARGLGLYGLHWTEALTHALHAPPQSVDTGLAIWTDLQGHVHHTPFLSSLTAGFDSAVGLRALNGPRWLRGLPRYLWATLGELIHLTAWDLQVSADGQPLHQGPALFASSLNTPTFGSGIPAVPHARMDDGQLNVLWSGPFSRPGALTMLPRLLMGWHLSDPRIATRAFETLTIHCASGVPLAADGEYLGIAGQLTVRSCPAGLHAITRHLTQTSPK